MRQARVNAQLFRQQRNARLALSGGHRGIERRDGNILFRRQIRHQVIALKNKSQPAAAQLRQRRAVGLMGGDAVDIHFTAAGFIQTTDNIHQRRFTRAGSAHNRHHLAGHNGQRNGFQHRNQLRPGNKMTRDVVQQD